MTAGIEQAPSLWTYFGYALLWALVAAMVFLFGRFVLGFSTALLLPLERLVRWWRGRPSKRTR